MSDPVIPSEVLVHAEPADPENRWDGIGASEAPLLVAGGTMFGKSRADIYREKLGLVGLSTDEDIDPKTKEAMEIGLLLEPAVAEMVHRQSGFRLVQAQVRLRSRAHPFITCTPDYWVYDGDQLVGVCQTKTRGDGRAWSEGMPRSVWVQLQTEMLVTGLRFGIGAAIAGGKLMQAPWERAEPDEEFVTEHLVPTLSRFWERVQNEEGPPIDGTEECTAALNKLFPKHEEGEAVDLGGEFLEMDQELQVIKARIKEDEERRREIENAIRSEIGTAEMGRLPDGSAYTYRTQVVNHKAREARTTTSRVLRRKGAKRNG